VLGIFRRLLRLLRRKYFTLDDLEAQSVSLSDFKGQVDNYQEAAALGDCLEISFAVGLADRFFAESGVS